MIAYIIPIFVILAVNSFIVHLSKHSFGETIPMSFIGSTLLLFFSQLIFHTFNVGVYTVLAIAVVGLVLIFFKKEIREKYFTPGLMFFAMSCVFAILWDYNRTFTDFDEFWHWGLMIKESLRLDSFHCVEASNMFIHKDYPPFLPILELLWCKLGMHYSEGLITSGMHIFCFSMILPCVTEQICGIKFSVKERRFWKDFVIICCCSVVFLVLIETLDFARIYNTILADFPLGVTFGYCLYLIISEKALNYRFNYISLILGVTALVLIKQVGMAYAMVVISLFFVLSLVCGNVQKNTIRKIIESITLLTIPLALYLIWSAYVKSCNIADIRAVQGGSGQFDLSKIDIKSYIAAFAGGDELQHTTFWNFAKALLIRKVTHVRWLPISYLIAYLIVIAIIVIFALAYKDRFSIKKAISIGAVYTVGTVGYAFMLSVLFLFCFTTDEMMELRGYERYVDSFILGEIISLGLIFAELQSKKIGNVGEIKIWKPVVCTIVIVVLLGVRNLGFLIPQQILRNMDMTTLNVEKKYIEETTEPESTLTLVYDTNDSITGVSWYGGVQSYLQYCVNDRKLLWENDLYNLDYSLPEHQEIAKTQIAKSDYVYFMNSSERLNEAYSEVIVDGQLKSPQIYKVNKNGGVLRLISVE